VLSLERLIDPAKAWERREPKRTAIRDERKVHTPYRLPVARDRLYMDPHINPEEWLTKQRAKARREEIAEELGLFAEPTRDILGHLRDHAPLKPWQQDIVAILWEEAMYFAPQIDTKVTNEGFASWCDHHLMAGKRLAALGQKTHDAGIFEYARHKTGVLGGKWSDNPYKLGYELLLDIEERWDTGKFGREWAEAGLVDRRDWDRKLGQGRKKVFEVCKYHNDVTLFAEYFTQEFCDKHQFYEWKKYPDGKYVVESKDAKSIRRKLIRQRLNGGLPYIRLVDPNFKGKGYYLLEHQWDGRPLHEPYVRETLTAVNALWKNDVFLATKNQNEEDIIWFCAGHRDSDKDVMVMTRKEYERK
jgi:stage V sporulation protein R